MEVAKPEGKKVTVIDYDITLASGKDLPQFTIRPDRGDHDMMTATHLSLHFALTKHDVDIAREHIAVLSRLERTITLLPEKFEPKPNHGLNLIDAAADA